MAGSNKGTHWESHKYDCISPNHKDYIGEYRVWNSMKARTTVTEAMRLRNKSVECAFADALERRKYVRC